MSKELNAVTKEVLTKEIKKIQEKCLDTFNIIENSPLDVGITTENVGEKALNYIEGLRQKLLNSNTPLVNDENLILSEFLADSSQRVLQVQEVTAFTKGVILDIENEIEKICGLTRTAQEALSRPRVIQQDIRPEHIHKAKETFYLLKTELHGVIQSLFPNDSSNIIDVLGQLMQEKITEGSSGYIPVTQENYDTVQHLRDMDIVCVNPYNNREVKIAF